MTSELVRKWKCEDGLLLLRTSGSPLVATAFDGGEWAIDNIKTRERVVSGKGGTDDAERALDELLAERSRK